MPYIDEKTRGLIAIEYAGYSGGPEHVDPPEEAQLLIDGMQIATPGELNFAITKLIKAYWDDNPRYQTGNDIVGVLDCAKLEFYRRVLAPYEDEKIKENGDIY